MVYKRVLSIFAVKGGIRTKNVAGVSGGQDAGSPCVSVNQEAKDDMTILTPPVMPTADLLASPAAWSGQPGDHVEMT